MARILLNVPKQARRGEAIEIKLLINHPMETGQRRDETGRIVPRNIIKDVVCTYGGAEVVRLELFPAISANPFLHFAARVGERIECHVERAFAQRRKLRHRFQQ